MVREKVQKNNDHRMSDMARLVREKIVGVGPIETIAARA
jgi:hypothetical protein